MLKKAILALVVGLLLAGCGKPPEEFYSSATVADHLSAAPIIVGYSAAVGDDLPIFVASDLGFFEKRGLKVELVFVPTGQAVTEGLVAGNIQVAMVSGESISLASAKGAPLVVIGAGVSSFVIGFYGRRGMTLDAAKTIVSAKGGESGAAVRIGMGKGILPGSVKPVFVDEGGSARIAAIKAGVIDIAPLAPALGLEAEDRGLVKLADLSQFTYPASTLSTTESFVQKHPEAIKRFLEAYLDGLGVVRNDQRKTTQVIEKWLDPDAKKAAKIYDIYSKYFAASPVPSRAIFVLVSDGDRVKIDPVPMLAALTGRG